MGQSKPQDGKDVEGQRRREEAQDMVLREGVLDDGLPNLRVYARAASHGMGMETAMVAMLGSNDQVRTLGFWHRGSYREDLVYDPANTPCEGVLEHGFLHLPDTLRARFPEDQGLRKLKAESYVGLPIIQGRRILGHIAVMDSGSRPEVDAAERRFLELMARRAAGDLTLYRTVEAGWMREQGLSALVTVQRKLMECEDPRLLYDAVVYRLGTISRASRVYFFEAEDGGAGFRRAAEWRADNTPERGDSEFVRIDADGPLGHWFDELNAGRPVDRMTVDCEGAERELLETLRVCRVLALPVRSHERLYGFIGFDNCATESDWDTSHADLLRAAASSLAFALHNHETARRLEWQLKRNQLLDRVARELRSQGTEEIFRRATRLIGEAFDCSRCTIHHYLPHPIAAMHCVAEHCRMENARSMEGVHFVIQGDGLAREVCESQVPVAIGNMLDRPDLRELHAMARLYRNRAALACRTTYRGDVNGLICVFSDQAPRRWRSEEIELLGAVAGEVGIALGQAAFVETLSVETEGHSAARELFQDTATKIGEMFLADRCVISEYVHEDGTILISPVAEHIRGDWPPMVGQRVPLADSSITRDFLRDQKAWGRDDTGDPALAAYRPWLEAFSIRSILIVPTFQHGQPIGHVSLHQCGRTRAWTEDEMSLMDSVAGQVALILQQGRTLEQERRRRHELANKNLELEEARHQAEVANRAKGDFLAHMSHELRTPLSAILGYAQLLEREPGTKDRHREMLRTICRSGEHLLDLINNILEKSRNEPGPLVVPSNFDLRDLFRSIEDLYTARARARSLRLEVRIDDRLPDRVHADKGKLRQALASLVNSVIQASSGGEVPVVADLLAPTELRVVVGVTDPATPGFIPLKDLSHREDDNPALGLSISRRFIAAMGGSLEVRPASEVEPAAYRMSVPFETVAPSPLATAGGGAVRLVHKGEPPRVLVVDDNEMNRVLLCRTLESLGLAPESASDGEEAFQRWRDGDPDLCFLDVRMPDINGLELGRAIRTQAGPGRPVLIAVSADARPTEWRDWAEAGFQDYMAKPLDPDDLVAGLVRHLSLEFALIDAPDKPASEPAPTNERTDLLAHLDEDDLEAIERAARALDAESVRRILRNAGGPVPAAVESALRDFRFDRIWGAVQTARGLDPEDVPR